MIHEAALIDKEHRSDRKELSQKRPCHITEVSVGHCEFGFHCRIGRKYAIGEKHVRRGIGLNEQKKAARIPVMDDLPT